jgi:hypothetical protein
MRLFSYIARPLLVSYTQPRVYCQLAIFASSHMIVLFEQTSLSAPKWIPWNQKVHSELLGFWALFIVWYSEK